MARYRRFVSQGGTVWCLMSPRNPWEALRIAWMMWRYPDQIAALVGVPDDFVNTRLTPEPAPEASNA